VQQMDQVTQQNAANAEETASASEEMSAQALNMKEQIGILAAQVGGSSRADAQSDTHQRSSVNASLQIAHTQHVKPAKTNDDHAEALIPMGENRITEHDAGLKDF